MKKGLPMFLKSGWDERFTAVTELLDDVVLRVLRSPLFLSATSVWSSFSSRFGARMVELREDLLRAFGIASRRDTDRILHLLERIEGTIRDIEDHTA